LSEFLRFAVAPTAQTSVTTGTLLVSVALRSLSADERCDSVRTALGGVPTGAVVAIDAGTQQNSAPSDALPDDQRARTAAVPGPVVHDKTDKRYFAVEHGHKHVHEPQHEPHTHGKGQDVRSHHGVQQFPRHENRNSSSK
jgi:hypothetical protein